MKKIGKISINPEKVIKNEELVNLRGGYGGPGCCMCTVVYYSGQQETLAACNGYTDCRDAERDLWSSIGGGAISIGCE
jgi:hypothetical protein